MSRATTACMMRIKNEEEWIARSLARTFEVAEHVILFDDGSTDATEDFAFKSVMGERALAAVASSEDALEMVPWGWIARAEGPHGPKVLHFLKSPFAGAIRESERVSEIRDKNVLFQVAKALIPFTYMLCLDGDEMLSREAIRNFPAAIAKMDAGVDIVQFPFIYVWDAEDQQRDDGIYGATGDGHKMLRFPRLFTIQRMPLYPTTNDLFGKTLFDQKFEWRGSRGGFHCGSIPNEGFLPGGSAPRQEFMPEMKVVHFGYIWDTMRRRKYEWYNTIDPKNEFEGNYLHVIGEPDQWAPGPVKLIPWVDE